MDNKLMKKSFLELSCTLTGFELLNKELTEAYYNGINQAFPADFEEALVIFDNLKKANPEEIEPAIYKAAAEIPAFKTIIKNIIAIWYLGKLDKVTAMTFNPVNYYEALAWKTVQAHSPGLSGGYFGYWHYQPEN
jgi:hypothetical protein